MDDDNQNILGEGVLKILLETPYIVTRHDPYYYPHFSNNEPIEGRWYKRTDVMGVHVKIIRNLIPTRNFEFRDDDNCWAQVYMIEKP